MKHTLPRRDGCDGIEAAETAVPMVNAICHRRFRADLMSLEAVYAAYGQTGRQLEQSGTKSAQPKTADAGLTLDQAMLSAF
ncbi:hypothetical protein NUV25_18275 [Burkholderia pseudomultivorans]|uniref:hypothetical protein n=1 Tax=Burkholderia pseudomultivorans TaxID=1207504 RepID=UPI002876ABCB|nr:hypothetical protein [Burkholderia pseudomultivorans]MDS0859655.1 hypothetical protein [Burkholderia pseudomultivorans]